MKSSTNISTIIQKKFGLQIINVVPLTGGFNCDVFKATDATGRKYLIKKYKLTRENPEKRLAVEFVGLMFLWKNGIRNIPEPLYSDPEKFLGVYEYVEGEKIRPGSLTNSDINVAVRFWESMNSLKNTPEAQHLPVAKEACFTLGEYVTNFENRLSGLLTLPKNSSIKDLHQFLIGKIDPFYKRLLVMLHQQFSQTERKAELGKKYRTLSSSDFGFHNAIRKADGTIIFHDFEYFGWDDPAKMVADFFLHPRMILPNKYRNIVFDFVYKTIGDPGLPKRLAFVYLILALKWCLIMLNVFKEPETVNGGNEYFAKIQLDKAKNYLKMIEKEFNENIFPVSLAIEK